MWGKSLCVHGSHWRTEHREVSFQSRRKSKGRGKGPSLNDVSLRRAQEAMMNTVHRPIISATPEAKAKQSKVQG